METVEARPLTARCARIEAEREHVLLGISALNGYFNLPTITELLRWAVRRFARVDVLVPGVELANTLLARGVSSHRVPAKARAASGNTRNRVMRALAELKAEQVGVFSWTELAADPAYAGSRQKIERLFATDSGFREHCLTAVRPIVGGPAPSLEQAETALPFLFAELPLVLDSPSILGVRSSLFCYPRLMPLVTTIYAGMLPIYPAAGQGFMTTRLTVDLAPRDHLVNGGTYISTGVGPNERAGT